ncbi:glycosyltransferase family 2 protein [Exiguobacterium alkaliphilum]|uniref:glycosyltransferase family 2 protein n=1 Tax=Exiguobacterium alkaliphilum TaxID=1428684 RepID=UPI0023EC5454|nr:glycosyltransferase family 2 protein [Exiguobacterium alkaliphilum]
MAPWIEPLAQFVFWYPFFMALFWISGAVLFSLTREQEKPLDLNEREWPLISILVPCYNEEETIEETITYLDRLTYPNLEIIAVNDGSSDRTGDLLIGLADKHDRLRVIDCHENRGKANALHMAAHAAHSEYLLCVDSDAFLDEEAPYQLVRHFLKGGERVGAVTGNPRIRNRDTLLSRMQIVEYASIIGSIKRTQRVMGKS